MAYADAFPAETELMGASRLLAAAIATRARIHIRQVSCPQTVELAQRMKPLLRPTQLTIEVTPHHLYLDRSAIETQGVHAIMGPPLRTPAEAAALRAALRCGAIDIVCTDHAPHLFDEKLSGEDDVWKCPPGTPGLETLLPSLLTAVHRGEMTLPELARVACEQPARIFGLYPRKGVIAPGSDADIVIYDPNKSQTLGIEMHHMAVDYSAYEGEKIDGKCDMVMSRGRIVIENNTYVGSKGQGSYVKRGLSSYLV